METLSGATLNDHIDELAAFEPNGFPVVSLCLNMQPDQHGRDNFGPFVRKEFRARAKALPADSPELASFTRDAERITQYLRTEVRPSANGLAIFACAGAREYFKAVQLDAPVHRHQLHVCREPHLVAADMLVARAGLSGASVIFIEDTALLAGVGGVAALLRYRL